MQAIVYHIRRLGSVVILRVWLKWLKCCMFFSLCRCVSVRAVGDVLIVGVIPFSCLDSDSRRLVFHIDCCHLGSADISFFPYVTGYDPAGFVLCPVHRNRIRVAALVRVEECCGKVKIFNDPSSAVIHSLPFCKFKMLQFLVLPFSDGLSKKSFLFSGKPRFLHAILICSKLCPFCFAVISLSDFDVMNANVTTGWPRTVRGEVLLNICDQLLDGKILAILGTGDVIPLTRNVCFLLLLQVSDGWGIVRSACHRCDKRSSNCAAKNIHSQYFVYASACLSSGRWWCSA